MWSGLSVLRVTSAEVGNASQLSVNLGILGPARFFSGRFGWIVGRVFPHSLGTDRILPVLKPSV